MTEERSTGPGCLIMIGGGCALLAVFFLISGFGSQDGALAFFPFAACTVTAALCFTLSDIRDRIIRIERHLDLDDEAEPVDSNPEVDGEE